MKDQKTVADIRAQLANMPEDMLITPANIFGTNTGENPKSEFVPLPSAHPKMVYANMPWGGSK